MRRMAKPVAACRAGLDRLYSWTALAIGDGSGSRQPRPVRAPGRSWSRHSALTEHPDHHPVAGPVLVEAGGVDRRVEPRVGRRPHVAGELVPPVPQQRRDLVVRVAAQRLGVDGQPGLAVPRRARSRSAGRRGSSSAGARRVGDQVAAERDRLLDQPVRHRRVPRQRGEPVGPPPTYDVERDAAAAARGRAAVA